MRRSGRILIVDDKQLFIDTQSPELEDLGYEVKGCLTGEECLELVKSFRPHVIILDLVLNPNKIPGRLDGEKVFILLKTDPEMRTTKIIIMTDHRELKDQIKALKAVDDSQIDDFIYKGFDLDQTTQIIDMWVRRATFPVLYMSHARSDLEWVKRINMTLEEVGFFPFVDFDELPHAGNIRDRAKALVEAKALICVLTPESVDSEKVAREIEDWLATKTNQSIFPILRETCVIPVDLRDRPYFDMRTDSEYNRAVLRLIGELRNLDRN